MLPEGWKLSASGNLYRQTGELILTIFERDGTYRLSVKVGTKAVNFMELTSSTVGYDAEYLCGLAERIYYDSIPSKVKLVTSIDDVI